MLDFKNKNILIAGSGGIGRELVKTLNDEGANLYLIDINSDLLSELKNAFPAIRQTLSCDFNNVREIEQTVSGLNPEAGGFDGFVYSAGITGSRPLNLTNYDSALKVMNINFFAFVEMVRCVIKKRLYNPAFSIVGLSSVGAFLGNASQTAYCASKAAMNGAVRAMAIELAKKAVRINTIAPGTTDTPMFREAEKDLISNSEAFKKRLERQYLGLCAPKDIVNSILFFLSDMSRMITGSCLTVDGGKLTS